MKEKLNEFFDDVIVVKNLYKNYGDFVAVRNVSFSVKKGEIVGLLGPNGAGKTTTMNILTGCISYSSGEVFVFGCDVFSEPLKAKKNVGYLPENPPLYQSMTVFEYLKFVCDIKKVSKKKEEIKRVLGLCGLEEKNNKLISCLSKGFKQRVGIAQALIGNPAVLILDEPTSGLDPAQIVQVRSLIKLLSKKHTIILSTHILSEIQAVCDRIIIVNGGEIVADDCEENLLKSVKNSYFLKVFCSSKEELIRCFSELSEFILLKNFNLVDSNIIEFEINIVKELDDCELKISKALMQKNILILKFQSKGVSLEQFFINLIEKNA